MAGSWYADITAYHERYDSKQTQLLLDLCRDGCKADIGHFDELLKHGADPNGRDRGAMGFYPLIGLILKTTLYHRDGLYPIHYASHHGNKQLVELLLSHQVDVDKTTDDELQQTALHMVCESGHVEVAATLLKHGANVDKEDKYKRTALHMACISGHVEVAATLLTHGANVDKEDATKLLLNLCRDGCKADIGHFDELLKHGADPNACDMDGWYPIHCASYHGNKQLVELLLSHQADVDKTTDGSHLMQYPQTALHMACESGHVEVVATLLKHGANVDKEDEYKETALHMACKSGHVEVAATLLTHGANVDKEDAYKETALHMACERGHVKVAATLLKNGANVDKEDKMGWTALTHARMNGHRAVLSLLEKETHFTEQSQSELEDDNERPPGDQVEREDEATPSSPVPSGHILTEPELQVLSRLLATYSNEKIKKIEQAVQKRRGKGVSRQEVERSLREVGMTTIADELEQNLQKGVENAEHYQAYKAALEGAKTLPLRYLKFLFFGSPRSGKSTMRQRLLQEIINLAILGQPSVSTGVAEACEVIIKKMTSETAAIAGSQWHSLRKSIKQGTTNENVVGIDIEYLTQIFYHLISKTMTSIQSPTTDAIPQPASSEATKDQTPHDDDDADGPSPPTKKAKYEEASVEVTTDRSCYSEMAEIDKSFDELASILQSDSPEKLYDLLKSLTLINMSDVGGQPEFLDVIPALTVGAALYLLFFRLDQEVHERYPVKYLAPGSTIERTLTSSYCIEEVLHQALASIACFSGHLSEKNAYSAPSRAILIGTYKDQVTASDIAEKEKEIREKFMSAEVYKDLLLTTKEGKPFFTVDNMNGTDESEMSEIRSNIENIVKAFFEEVPIPASWLMFRVMLHLLNKPLVSLPQCEEIARRLSMHTPVQEALWFFHHHVGSLLYYPDIPSMRGTVICTPQVIFDSISTVIIGNFQYSNYQVPRKAVEQFQQTGLFGLSDISKQTEEHRSNHLAPNQLVDVLKYQGILAEVKHDEGESSSEPAEPKVIIPAVLEHASDEELKPSPSLQAFPLMIRFEGGFIPFGLFSASIARLIAHADSMSPKWKLCEKEVRKNKVKFLVAGAYYVTLISRPRYLEIQLERYSPQARCKHSLADICSSIRLTIVETLETTVSKMQYRPQACIAATLLSSQRPFHFAFSCCVSESEPHSGHLMKVDEDEDGHYGVCLRDSAEVDLDKEHLYWFDKNKLEVVSHSEAIATCKSSVVSSNSGKLSIDDLQRVRTVTWDARAKWFDIGLALSIPAGTLDAVSVDKHDCGKCYTEMLTNWLKGVDPQPSWSALSDALKSTSVGCGDLAKQIATFQS